MTNLIYAGIGARKTPISVCMSMVHLAEQLAERGWILRSGHAEGADYAFETGCIDGNGLKEIYLPWPDFNAEFEKHGPGYIVPEFTDELMILAESYHPQWSACGRGARKLHARNVCQILGRDLSTPATMVVCWTEKALGLGGTGQALRIARAHDIPVFDLADIAQQVALIEFVQQLES